MITFASDLSLENFRLRFPLGKLSFDNYQLGIVRLGISILDLSLGHFRLGSCAWDFRHLAVELEEPTSHRWGGPPLVAGETGGARGCFKLWGENPPR